ncbi:MAG: hypothetical protein AAFX76_13655, partial [Planctomycetota bacterium]
GDVDGFLIRSHLAEVAVGAVVVAFIIAGPCNRHYAISHRSDHPLNHVDVAPTSLGLAGLTPPDTMQGFDYSPLAVPRGQLEDAPDAAYLQSVVPTGHGPSVDLPWRGLLTRDGWKYVALAGQPMMLYNLREDPYEQVNLAWHAHASGIRRRLNGQLQDQIERTGDRFSLPAFG